MQPRSKPNTTSVSTEVETIINLIEYLTSKKDLTKKAKITDEPDPEGKIEKKFAGHTAFLKKELQDYLPIYDNAREEAENALGLDSLKYRFIRKIILLFIK